MVYRKVHFPNQKKNKHQNLNTKQKSQKSLNLIHQTFQFALYFSLLTALSPFSFSFWGGRQIQCLWQFFFGFVWLSFCSSCSAIFCEHPQQLKFFPCVRIHADPHRNLRYGVSSNPSSRFSSSFLEIVPLCSQ